MSSSKAVCRLCGKNSFETGGWLERTNEKDVEGVWECRPSCEVKLNTEDRLLSAITGVFYGASRKPTN